MRADEPAPVAKTVDLLARWRRIGGFLFEQRGLGVLGSGEAGRGVVEAGPGHVGRAADLADTILADAGVPGAVVAGALPFAGDAAGSLVMPAVIQVTKYAPRVVHLGSPPGAGAAMPPPPDGPLPHLVWRPHPPRDGYASAVAEATRLIEAGGLSKVVLSRAIVAEHTGPIPVGTLLSRLRDRNPDCHIFAVPDGADGVFLGATPETLVRRIGDRVLSFPLAGTAARSPDPGTDRGNAEALLRSAKERSEHSFVVEAITDVLGPLCVALDIDSEPRLIATSAVWHLATMVRGTLRPPAPSALALAALLHPTPAVCGTPAGVAAGVIARLETGSRGLYAGLVGWVDGRGDGEWAVGLRCASIGPAHIRLDAGSGLVAGSTPEAELAETDAKFRTMLEALSL